MKILLTSLLILFTGIQIQAQVSAEYICTQFLAPDAGGVFRGLDFTMSDGDIVRLESERNNMNFIDANTDVSSPILNYRLNLSVSNYAKVAYDISGDVFNGVSGQLYVSNESAAIGVIDYMTNYYVDDLGSPVINDDGSTSFTGTINDVPVSLTLALMKDGTKNYVYYVLNKAS